MTARDVFLRKVAIATHPQLERGADLALAVHPRGRGMASRLHTELHLVRLGEGVRGR